MPIIFEGGDGAGVKRDSLDELEEGRCLIAMQLPHAVANPYLVFQHAADGEEVGLRRDGCLGCARRRVEGQQVPLDGGDPHLPFVVRDRGDIVALLLPAGHHRRHGEIHHRELGAQVEPHAARGDLHHLGDARGERDAGKQVYKRNP